MRACPLVMCVVPTMYSVVAVGGVSSEQCPTGSSGAHHPHAGRGSAGQKSQHRYSLPGRRPAQSEDGQALGALGKRARAVVVLIRLRHSGYSSIIVCSNC